MTARRYNLAATTTFVATAAWAVTGIVLAAGDNGAATVAPNPHWLADGCKECHDPGKKQGKKQYKLQNAFHKNCKVCHKEANKSGKKAPYKKCNDCHEKKS